MQLITESQAPWTPAFRAPDFKGFPSYTDDAAPTGTPAVHVGRVWDVDDPEFFRIEADITRQVKAGTDFLHALAVADHMATAGSAEFAVHAVTQAKDGVYRVAPVQVNGLELTDLRAWRARPANDTVKALLDGTFLIDFTGTVR